jgi:hypothetical protein
MAIRPLNSVAGFSVGETPANIILANGDITTTNITTTGVSNLNSVGNVKISGGSSGQVISTDGSGNLSFITIGTASLNNGTSNVSVLNSGNILFSVAGNANVGTFTGTGLNVAGYLNATGNANLGNLGTAQVLATANVTAPQLISNTSTGTAPLVVSSTTLVSNLNADLLDGYNSAVANTANTVAVRNSDGNLSANYFVGNGAFLTGIDTSLISNGNSNVAVAANGNVTINVAGNTGIATFTGTGANINGTANVTGNVIAGGVKTDNLYYANGTPWDLQEAAGANTQIQYNNGTNNNFGASANFTFNDATNVLTVTGNIAASNANLGNAATANFFIGSGNNLSNIQGANVSGTVATATTAGTVTTAAQPNITSVGTLSSLSVTGNVTGGNLNTVGNVNAPIMVDGGTGIYLAAGPAGYINFFTTGGDRATITDAGNIVASNLVANSTVFAVAANISGNVTSGNANLGNLATANFFAGTLTTAAQPNITSVGSLTSLTVTGTATAGNLSTGGTLSVTGNANVGNLGTAGLVVATGNVSGGNLTTGGAVVATGNVSGGNLTTGGAVVATGNVSGGNVTTGGAVVATGNVSGGNLTTGGLVNATGNIVSGANVVTDLIVGKTSSVTITATGTNQNVNLVPTGTGSVNVGNFIISNVATPVADSDAATKKYVDDVAQGLNIHDSCQAATPNTLAVVTGGTITYNNGTAGVGANLTTTGSFNLIDGVNVQTSGTRILVKNEANTVHNGIYTWSNATVITRAADFNSVPEVEAGDFVFVTAGTLYDNTGWVQISSPAAIGGASDFIEFTQFSGAGTYTAGTGLQLDGSVFSIANTTVTPGAYGNGDYNATFTVNQQGQLSAAANVAITANAANLTGTTLAATIVNSSLTSVGTLTALNVTGNAIAGNVYANSGTIGASLLAGTLTTAAQPNVTSVGTLTSLTVTGTATAGNLSTGGTLSVTGNANVGNLGTGGLIVATGNVTGGNLTTAGVVAATGNVTGGNLATAGVVAATGNVSGGNLTTAGVVAATGNVSGGNLTTAGALAVTGNASVGNLSATNGNLTTANVSGDIILGNASVTTAISWASATTTAITANQTIASFSATGVVGVEFVVKGIDSTGSKYSVATVQAVTDGTSVDYSTFGTVNLGGFTGSLAVNIVGGFVRLQVTPASSNSTVWTTQYRFI